MNPTLQQIQELTLEEQAQAKARFNYYLWKVHSRTNKRKMKYRQELEHKFEREQDADSR